MPLQKIENYAPGMTATEEMYRMLEGGRVLYFPQTPFELPREERDFLVSQEKTEAGYHKNISYRPLQDRLKGLKRADRKTRARMQEILRNYSRRAIQFTGSFLPRYAESRRIDYASFRPLEEEGRKIAFHSRNDLLHIDSFPTRPSGGDRLLRIFTNVHPTHPRVWITSDNFATLVHRYGEEAGLPQPPGLLRRTGRGLRRTLAGLRLSAAPRSEYDQFMLRFHHYMKENSAFQKECRKEQVEFSPGSSWIVFTDMTSHACLRGRHMLEQTFFIRRAGLVCPEKAPVAILESLTHRCLTG